MTFISQKLLYVAYVWIDVVVLKFISLAGQKFQRGGGGKMILVAVDAVPAGSKPPAAVGVRISTVERQDFIASTPLSTRASPMNFSGAIKRSSAIMAKLIKLVGSSSTLSEELSPCFALSAAAALSVRLRVFLSVFYVCLHGETWLQSSILQSC